MKYLLYIPTGQIIKFNISNPQPKSGHNTFYVGYCAPVYSINLAHIKTMNKYFKFETIDSFIDWIVNLKTSQPNLFSTTFILSNNLCDELSSITRECFEVVDTGENNV